MCAGRSSGSVAEALAAVRDGLAFLNQVDAADLPAAVQAECLRGLARAESAHTAAHARLLGAFSASGGHEDDGQQTVRAWLKWQTQVTAGAAAGAVGLDAAAGRPPGRRYGARGRDGVGVVGAADHRMDWTCSRKLTGPTRTRSCWPPRPGGPPWLTWLGWRRRCAAARLARTRSAGMGLRSVRCGWMSPSAGRPGWTAT